MKFDSKGQAFDVFKLLIAAVVALAMLAILIPMLTLNWGLSDPQKEAVNLITKQERLPSQYGEKQDVIFTNKMEMTAKAISENASAGLPSEQICFSKGDFSESEDFVIEGGSGSGNVILRYVGTTQKANIGVICDDGESIEGDLTDRGLESEISCGSGESPSGPSTYCVIILRK